ncbi:MAG: diacylglycerol kinase [Glaciihabitans sp.]|nr:diacylglycerol kinase [Glaciihabitans sp.]
MAAPVHGETTSESETPEPSGAPGTPRVRTAAVVFNPVKVDISRLRATVTEAEAASGWGASLWFETSVVDPGAGQARDAINAGVDVVMAAGGDGTVRVVAEQLRGSGIPLALLPSGTGNLLARNLGLGLDNLVESVATAFTGKDRRIDLGIVEARREDGSSDSHAFLVMAGFGLDADMIANTNPKLKARVGWLAYVDAIVRSLRGSNQLRVRYSLDGATTRTLHAHTVLIGNCGSLPGNILLLPEAAVDDGVFDIVALRPDGLVGWVQIWVKIVWENGVLRRSSVGRKLMSLSKEVRTLRYLRGSQLVMRLEAPQEFELDGDPFGKAVAIKATVDHLGLTVRIPADREIG